MEQFVLGIFQEHLSKFIVDFRKEQVNANLLNGKGEIRDVSLNCSVVNEILAKLTPFIELESIHVSKLSFHVTSWANLKKAPIVVTIEHVEAKLVEPLSFLDKSQRRMAQQITRQQLNHLIEQGLHKLRGAYNLFDRIVDNIHLEVSSINVEFQARGKFKTTRPGPWTPPLLKLRLKHVRFICVDEYGNEGSPEQVWEHNHNAHQTPMANRTYMIYKRASFACSLNLSPAPTEELPPLIQEAQAEVHFALKRRLRDAALLAVQLDVTLQKMEVLIARQMVPVLAHAMAGVQYCLAKDRSFDDPLVATEQVDVSKEPDMAEQARANDQAEEPVEDDFVGDDDDEDSDNDTEDESESRLSEESTSSSAEDDSVKPDLKHMPASSMMSGGRPSYFSRPVILLPNGLVLYDRLSLSLSVHQCTIRGVYNETECGHVQLVVKGLVSEVMWPKESGEKGGYVQTSLSYISLQEKYGPRVRSILLGGVQHDIHKLSIWLPGKPRPEKPADESFPLFEDRSIRPDPFGLRHAFPAQAFGIKMTINYIAKLSNPMEEDIMVHHEIGVDQFDILLDSEAWCRVAHFGMNEEGSGFDIRWHSGDWSDVLTADMLVDPLRPLNLSEHLQTTKEIFLDENSLISSDLMNMTARITNVEIRVPAAIREDVRSCDIVVSLAETMLVVSSALPRTFLSGKIGASILGEGPNQVVQIDFPNDPSDLCYALEQSEDPSMRQRGTMTTGAVSTARSQLTLRGFSVRIIPVIPFCNASQPQQLLEPVEMTTIVCFEGEPPSSPESNLIKIVLFVSTQIHRLSINCDLDVISGACSTLLSHADVVQEAAKVLEAKRNQMPPSKFLEQEGTQKMNMNMKNRRVLVRRQFARSRETGGLSVSLCIQMAEFGFALWRQNVPLTSRFRASLSDNKEMKIDETLIPLMKLCHIDMEGLEMGAESSIQSSNRRVVVKGCVSELHMGMCDFEMECASDARNDRIDTYGDESSAAQGDRQQRSIDAHTQIELVSFGVHAHSHRSYAEAARGHNDISLRSEDHLNSDRSMSLSCEIGPPGVVYLRVHEIETLCLLLIEALLMPSGIHVTRLKWDGRRANRVNFPDRSIGALFTWLIDRHTKGDEAEPLAAPTERQHKEEVDTVVHSLVTSFLPDHVHTVVLRVMVSDLLVFVPETVPDSAMVNEFSWLGLVVHQTTLVAGFFADRQTLGTEDYIMDMLATRGKAWSAFFDAPENGIHVLVRARPSLYAAEGKNSMCVTADCLVSEFEVSCLYRPSNVAVSMGDTTLSVKNLDDLNHMYSSLMEVEGQSRLSKSKIDAVLSGLSAEPETQSTATHAPSGPETSCSSKDVAEEGHSNIVLFAHESSLEAEYSLRGLGKAVHRLRDVSEVHSMALHNVLEMQQRSICSLRYEAFSKERDRVAALALVSSVVTGWLRMGGTHTFGQRVPGVTTMWRYYAVLHGSLLILYPSPGEPKPVDTVLLDGAHLFPLAGGHRKRDVLRGFSIVEKGGVVRFFMADSGPDYELWIREIHKTTSGGVGNAPSVVSEDASTDPASVPVPGDHVWSSLGGPAHVDVARSVEFNGEADYDETGQSTTSRREKMRERLSVVASATKGKLGSATASTKSRLGSAVQVARQIKSSRIEGERESSINVLSSTVEGPTSNTQTAQMETPVAATASHHHAPITSLGKESTDVHTRDGIDQPNRASGRFASIRSGTKNRLGSALQVAKEKGKAAAEKGKAAVDQRRQRQQQQLDHAASHVSAPFAADAKAPIIVPSSNPSLQRSAAHQVATAAIVPPAAASTPAHAEPAMTAMTEGSIELEKEPVDGSFISKDLAATHSDHYRGTADHDLGIDSSCSTEGDEVHLYSVSGTDHDMHGHSALLGTGPSRRLLGAAVKSVRRTVSQDSCGLPGDTNTGRFSLRRRFGSSMQADSANMNGSYDSTTLRGIRVGRGNPVDALRGRENHDIDLKLRRIERCWIARVEICKVESDIASRLATENGNDESKPSDGNVPNNETLAPPEHEEESIRVDARRINDASAYHDGGDDLKESIKDTPSQQVTSEQRQLVPEMEFRIHYFPGKVESEAQQRLQPIRIVRSLSDVLAFHTTISTCVSCLQALADLEPRNVSSEEDGIEQSGSVLPHEAMTILEIVRLAGRLLSGILSEYDSRNLDDTKAFAEYQCELLKQFLNLTLECPLPENAIDAVSRFLERPDMQTSPYEASLLSKQDLASVQLDFAGLSIDPVIASTTEILSCTIACENELIRAETQGRHVHALIERFISEQGITKATAPRDVSMPFMIVTKKTPFLEPLLPSEVTSKLHEAIHGALMNVMTERDESHAQLIAASVLHMHGMEQERKRVARLTEQLEAAQALLRANQNSSGGNRLFQDQRQAAMQSMVESSQMKDKMNAIQEQMIQSSEEDMIVLCQQLASEISAKTNASLEIIRLKESRNIEQQSEQAEKDALKTELKRCKELLAEEQQRACKASEEALAWKKAYEELAKTNESNHSGSEPEHL